MLANSVIVALINAGKDIFIAIYNSIRENRHKKDSSNQPVNSDAIISDSPFIPSLKDLEKYSLDDQQYSVALITYLSVDHETVIGEDNNEK